MNAFRSEIRRFKSLVLSKETIASEICDNGVDLSKLCRTCLCETTDNDLSNGTASIISPDGQLVRLSDILEVVTGLKTESNDGLPHHLCSTCLVIVNNAYTFRTQSQRADEILRSIVQKKSGEVRRKDVVKRRVTEEPLSKNPDLREQSLQTKRKVDDIRMRMESVSDIDYTPQAVIELEPPKQAFQPKCEDDHQVYLECDHVEVDEEISELDSMQTSNTATPQQPNEQVKLSGAGRKRLKWLLANGHSEEEARQKAQLPSICRAIRNSHQRNTARR